jgi:hypothetical protein
MRWTFAAYKQGALAGMGGGFAQKDMGAAAFRQAFVAEVHGKYDAVWTLFAMTGKGFAPVGIVFGAWMPLAPIVLIAGIAFFPWATRRNIVEAAVNFFAGVRKQVRVMGYARPEHKRLYEVCCAHGIMRRVGTSQIVFPDTPAAVYEAKV